MMLNGKNFNVVCVYIAMIGLILVSDLFHLIEMESSFFITLSVPVFLLFLLYFHFLSPVRSGLIVGLSVFGFRTTLSVIEEVPLAEALLLHAPVVVFFVIYGILFWLFYLQRFYSNPGFIGVYAIILDTASAFAELAIRNELALTDPSLSLMTTVILLAVLRNFFVMGFFMLILYNKEQTKYEEQKKQSDHMFLLISDLFAESAQLRYSMARSEKITSNLYYLSKELKQDASPVLAKKSLEAAGEVHDLKKEYQRTHAALSQIIKDQKKTEKLNVCQLLEILIKSNESYAAYLEKNIVISVSIHNKEDVIHSFLTISVLNNLISNSIEAIEHEGHINIKIDNPENTDFINIKVTDNGPGVKDNNKSLIFSAGFTTKFNDEGIPSNGIGLSYIKYSLEKFNGGISLIESTPNIRTCFSVEIPRDIQLN
ncbi:two-component system, sensor histidine kinase YcbA [Salisediminibacterium halotolerans]|uniref:histidine kinase n=1 Tax=Salisediminibacterium halotolerans TaxID=517425 RepID=A0A1H9SVY4_9BACI|nr:two-component system, sensor histidine kinase YcbA [Salisediminibacterium haloalkalitolerans]